MAQVERVFTASIGGEYSAVWYTSLFFAGWVGTKISFLNLFVIFHQEPAMLGRIRLPHAGFLSYTFPCDLSSHGVLISLLVIQGCCINSVPP